MIDTVTGKPFMRYPHLHRIVFLFMLAATLVLLGAFLIAIGNSSKTRPLTIAAGASTGDSYLICEALKTVAEKIYPDLRITVKETAGTVENLRLLEDGKADLASAQADVDAGTAARSVAVLFDDMFQLLAHHGDGIESFAGLRGRRIAISRGGGQFDSFLRVAAHFDMGPSDFRLVGSDERSADQAFVDGNAEALFHVRSLGNPMIQQIVKRGQVDLVPIPQALAMRINHAAFNPAVIPAGAYNGEPPVPSVDLPTVAIHRLMLARQTADPVAVREITAVLIGHRNAIMNQLPAAEIAVRQLLAQTRRPDPASEFCPALHPGASAFYDRDKPSFIQAHADFVGLLLTVFLMVGSWIWQVKSWMEHSQKNNADSYTKRVMSLIKATETASTLDKLAEIHRDLLALLTEAVTDLDHDKLSEQSFSSVRAVLQIALVVSRERRDVLAGLTPGSEAYGHLVSGFQAN